MTRIGRPAERPSGSNPKNLLLVLVAGIGDFVMATPTIRSIRGAFPSTHLTLLTSPQAAGLARPCPLLDEVLAFDLRAYRPGERGTGWLGWRDLWSMAIQLRARHIDLAVNLYQIASVGGVLRMGLFFALIGARRTAGRWSGGLGFYFGTRGVDRPHAVDAMLALAAALGCPVEDGRPALWIPDASRHSAAEHLHRAGLAAGDRFVAMNIGSNRREARLPFPLAVEIGGRLSRSLNRPVLFLGDASEREAVQEVCAEVGPDARSLAGALNLLELAALFERASIVVSTDSGPMHMAAAVAAPLVALYGPADPARFGPRGAGPIVVLQGKSQPRHPLKWHADLTAEEVVSACSRLLTASPVTGRNGPG
ncbi:MAG TPA: glycosyltransferase family 9 protein [Candidatus Methylomirabilis sp.]|nr:glycosyltransferase family 9 protein [Candidatus Methylomirabilis sp.]